MKLTTRFSYKRWASAAAAVMCAAFFFTAQPSSAGTADHIAPSACGWLLGVNYPWLHYGDDFGQAAWPGGAWTHEGMSAAASTLAVRDDFAFLQQQGVRTVRVFVFADGRASPEFDGAGNVTGFDSFFYADFDALITLASEYDLYLMPVLLDFYWLDNPQTVNGVQLGGHADVVADAAKRQSFMDNALRPLLQRYGSTGRISAWEVMNEPEWMMSGVPGSGGSAVTIAEMQAFVGEVVTYVHQYAAQPVTVGSARSQWLAYWQELGLDFYEFHYYDSIGAAAPFSPYTTLGLDKPAVLGEFPTASTANTVTTYLTTTWQNGYAGALAWSLNAADPYSAFRSVADEFKSWAQSHNTEATISNSTCTEYLPLIDVNR